MSEKTPSAQERIAIQQAIVASLVPGSAEHELATKVLLLLMDSLHLMNEIRALTIAARAAQDGAAG